MFVLLMTFDGSFFDQWAEGVFETREKAYDKMKQLYETKLSESESGDDCVIDDLYARIEDCYGNGSQWQILRTNE